MTIVMEINRRHAVSVETEQVTVVRNDWSEADEVCRKLLS